MNTVRDHCERARESARAGIDPNRRFPRNVFVGDWADVLFFDSDWMRESDFVDHVKAFLDVDGAQCACLWKLDSEDPNEPRFVFVRQQTTSEEYRALLTEQPLGMAGSMRWSVSRARPTAARGACTVSRTTKLQ